MVDLARFASHYPFPLDDFQVRAIEGLAAGESVLVAAPTGAGKTVVAEYAVEQAIEEGAKAFYTTPLKALSNQKFGDFVARYGAGRVGLLTGDNSINSEAPVVVMTTEVLRNMLYEQSSTLSGLRFVVMDEVHYLQDPYRGAVWEEVLIHLPLATSVVCLSATVSNAEEFGEWIGTLRGPTRVVIEERRPVPLEHFYMIGSELLPIHVEREGEPVANPAIVTREREQTRRDRDRDRGRQVRSGRRDRPPRREEVVDVLADAGMLPAIYFVFSRAGCERSVEWMMEARVRLTTQAESERIREFAELRAASIPDEDLVTLRFAGFLEALAAGVASHHAGMLPIFKETVEELFKAGLVKLVFATETLSLGINMPARTVVIENLWKFSGERHELLTPGEYTQLTGRAGRRGIDEVGFAVVAYQRQVPFDQVASLTTRRTYELTSSFRPSYNMAVNLVRAYSPEEAHHLLNSSFGQFLTDRSVVAMERELERGRAGLAGYEKEMRCDRGDFAEYWALREQARALRERARSGAVKARQDEIKAALAKLRPGDVIFVPGARRRGLAVVLGNREGRPTVLTQDRRFFRASPRDFEAPPSAAGTVPLPRGSARSARFRRDLAARLVTLDIRPPKPPAARADPKSLARADTLDRRADAHPCAACPDRATHERWAERWSRVRRQVEALERRIRGRTETLARRFDRVLAVLEDLGYVHGFELSTKGERLCRIYAEGDVLVGEALASAVFDGLAPSELAALVSTVVYESRERTPRAAALPTEAVRLRFRDLQALWGRIRTVEERHRVELVRELDAGFAASVFGWAEGKPLEDVLVEIDMAPGDFVRTCKQLLDLLRQIKSVAPDPVSRLAGEAVAAVNRGVVSYTGL